MMISGPGCFSFTRYITTVPYKLIRPGFNATRVGPHPFPDKQGRESIVISCSFGVILQMVNQKPTYMLESPGPGIIALPSLLNGRLHDSGLP